MTEAFGLDLSDKLDVCQLVDILDAVKLKCFIGFFKRFLQFLTAIKMVFNNALAAIGDDQDIGDTCRDRFFNNILNSGLIHDRKHFFGHRFGCGKNSCTKPRGRNNSFRNFHVNLLI